MMFYVLIFEFYWTLNWMTRKIWMNFAVELTVNSATVLSAIQCSQVRWAIDKSIKHQSCVVKTQKLTCKPHKRALQFTDHQLCILDLDNDFPFQSNHHFTPSRRWIASYCSSHEIWLAYSNALAGDFHEDSICSKAAKWEIDQKVTSSFLRDTHAGIEPTLKKKQKKVSRMDKLSVDMMMGPPPWQ